MIHSRASVRFLPQSDPVLQRNTKLNCTLKLQTFVQGLKSATSKPTYARLHPFLRGKHSVDGNKPSRGKGKEIVRLCARSLYTARALCAASLSFSFCSVPFKVSDMCTISVCCYMNRSPVISGLDLRVRLYNLKWSVQCFKFVCIIPRVLFELHRTLKNNKHYEWIWTLNSRDWI